MTTATIRGIVRGGKVEPLDKLDAEEGTEVSISVPIRQKQGNGTMITFGMFAKPGARLSTECGVHETRAWCGPDHVRRRDPHSGRFDYDLVIHGIIGFHPRRTHPPPYRGHHGRQWALGGAARAGAHSRASGRRENRSSN